MTVGGLISNLTVFADFYERASAAIDGAEPVLRPWHTGSRDANIDSMQRDFQSTVAIDRARSYVVGKYGADLTIGTARRFLGDLVRICALTVEAAEALALEAAMDMLDAAEQARREAGTQEKGSGAAPAIGAENAARSQKSEHQRTAIGFLGGTALADALGVHASQREAFFKKLERNRISLGDACWQEVANPRPNSPRFLYRADAPKVRALAASYQAPKPT
jgi:hypothetical protein